MGFWLFMLIMILLIPLTMIGLGSRFQKKPPKEINSIYGYRTVRSMKSKESWFFAHVYAGKIWRRSGWITLFVSAGILLLLLGQDMDRIGRIGGALCLLQCIPLIAVIFPTEAALKKNFDEQGRRIPSETDRPFQ